MGDHRPRVHDPRKQLELTSRQEEVLRLVARGLTNPQIAAELGITLDGAKWHVREIIGKLGVSSREEAAAYWRDYHRPGHRLARFMRGAAAIPLRWAGVALAGAAVAAGVLVATLALSNSDTPPADDPTSASSLPTPSPTIPSTPPATPPTGTSDEGPTGTADIRWQWRSDVSRANTFVAASDDYVVVSAAPEYSDIDTEPRTLALLDAETGEAFWAHQLPAAPMVPAIAQGIVAVGDVGGAVRAFDLETGNPRWTYEAGGSPAVLHIVGDLVVGGSTDPESLGADGIGGATPSDGAVFALEISSGNLAWQHDAGGPYSSIASDGQVVVALRTVQAGGGSADGELVAFDPATGEELWKAGPVKAQFAGPPVIHGDIIFAWGSDLVAVHRDTGEELWRFALDAGTVQMPAVAGNHVIVGTNIGITVVLDRATGTKVAELDSSDCSWLATSDGATAYASCSQMIAMVLDDTGQNGEPAWTLDIPGGFTPAAIHGDSLYVGTRNSGYVFAINR